MKMSNHYAHTQPGTMMVTLLLANSLIPAAVAAFANDDFVRWICIAMAIGLVITAGLFSSLTVSVGEGELRWFFGLGLWHYGTALTDIQSTGVVRNKWYYGFGIRMLPGFRLYNVGGLDAVEIKLRDGRVRRIGTDDPAGLAAALRTAS
jgi:hypothetical protein